MSTVGGCWIIPGLGGNEGNESTEKTSKALLEGHKALQPSGDARFAAET